MLPEYEFDYGKARPNRFARQNGESGHVMVILAPDVANVSMVSIC